MSADQPQEHGRAAEQARRRAHETAARAEERARAQAERSKALTGERAEEVVRQFGLIYAGLIGIAVVMMQGYLEAPSLDRSAKISLVAFSVAIPFLAALALVNRAESFRRRQTPSIIVTVARVVAQLAAFVGIVAGFWHIQWIVGVGFLTAVSSRWGCTPPALRAWKWTSSPGLTLKQVASICRCKFARGSGSRG